MGEKEDGDPHEAFHGRVGDVSQATDVGGRRTTRPSGLWVPGARWGVGCGGVWAGRRL